jgi:putative endonuclease
MRSTGRRDFRAGQNYGVSLRWRSDGSLKQFSLYVMSNSSMSLYTGATNDLRSRVSSHKEGSGSQFTARYHFDRLVYFETYERAIDAISREKQIKGLTRAKKIALIKRTNPTWRDLSEDL